MQARIFHIFLLAVECQFLVVLKWGVKFTFLLHNAFIAYAYAMMVFTESFYMLVKIKFSVD